MYGSRKRLIPVFMWSIKCDVNQNTSSCIYPTRITRMYSDVICATGNIPKHLRMRKPLILLIYSWSSLLLCPALTHVCHARPSGSIVPASSSSIYKILSWNFTHTYMHYHQTGCRVPLLNIGLDLGCRDGPTAKVKATVQCQSSNWVTYRRVPFLTSSAFAIPQWNCTHMYMHHN